MKRYETSFTIYTIFEKEPYIVKALEKIKGIKICEIFETDDDVDNIDCIAYATCSDIDDVVGLVDNALLRSGINATWDYHFIRQIG